MTRVTTAAADVKSVAQLQAALMLTFARFVEWSSEDFSSPVAPVVVAIIADEETAAALEGLSLGKQVAGRPLALKRLQWDSDLAGVHMLFIGVTDKRRVQAAIDQAITRRVVTVSAVPEFGRLGGMITIGNTSGRLGFSVNSSATARGGVRLSSFLLSHATKVSATAREGTP